MKTVSLLAVLGFLGVAGVAQAQTETFNFNLTDSATGVTAQGSITGTLASPGVYTGTSGVLIATIGGQSYTAALDPAGISIADIDPPAATVTLSGADNLIGVNFMSQDGSLFSNPVQTQSGNFTPPEDVFGLEANSSNTGYELDWLGTDFPGTPYPFNSDTDLQGSITEAPEPSSWATGLLGLAALFFSIRRRRLDS